MSRLRLAFAILATCSATSAMAVDLERFNFNDANGTPLSAAVNSANPGNNWFYAEEATTPGDDTSGDISTVQSGAYRIITNSGFASGLESRYLNIANTSSGKLYLSATFSGWNFSAFDASTDEQFRLTFLDDDTGNSGSSVTAQVEINRNTTTGAMELIGNAIGTAGSFNISNAVTLADTQTQPFTVVLALDKDSNSYEVFYKDGASPSQSLGLGGVSRVRGANSIRMVTANFGVENFLPFLVTEEVLVDSIVLSDTNPLTDLITLEVNRSTGAMTLINTSGAAVSGVSSVSLSSATGSVDLSQLASFSGTLGVGQSVALDIAPASAPGLWVRSPIEDVNAQLNTAGGVRTLNVNFVGNNGAKWLVGDLDFDGAIDADDYLILAANAEKNLSSLSGPLAYQMGDLDGNLTNDALDFGIFKNAFEAANGGGSFAQMLAGIPEPGTALLAALGLTALVRRRRLSLDVALPVKSHAMSHRLRKAVISLAPCLVALVVPTAQSSAAILEDFNFNESAGAGLLDVENSANAGNGWYVSSGLTDTATTGTGSLRVRNSSTSLESNYLDIANISTGKAWLVVEISGWSFNAGTADPADFDPANLEQIRFGFVNGDTAPNFGSTLAGQFQIERVASGGIQLIGNTAGTGSSNISGSYPLSLDRSTPFTVALEIDQTEATERYRVYYKDNTTTFAELGTGGVVAPSRNANAIRFAVSDRFSGVGEFFDINRIYLTDMEPAGIEPPKLLTLQVHPKSGYAALVNENNISIDIDHYKITSGDNSLQTSGWNSFQDQQLDAVDGPDGGSTAGDGAGERWTEAGGSGPGVISESFLLSSSVFDPSESQSLGRIYNPAGDSQLLGFEYRDAVAGGDPIQGNVVLAEGIAGDFNLDGRIDAADYTIWRDNASGLFVAGDYAVWASNYGATGAPTLSVPEPAGFVAAVLFLSLTAKRRAARSQRA